MAIYTVHRDGTLKYYRSTDDNDQNLGKMNLEEYAAEEGCSLSVAREIMVSVCEDYAVKSMNTWDVLKSPNGTFVKQEFPQIHQ